MIDTVSPAATVIGKVMNGLSSPATKCTVVWLKA